jgi:hypothetical protein
MKSKARRRLSWGVGLDPGFCRRRLRYDRLRLHSLRSPGRKKLSFRREPELQIPPLRATCLFPEPEGQAGDFMVVRADFWKRVLIHGALLTLFKGLLN